MKEDTKERLTLRLSPITKCRLYTAHKDPGCRSMNELTEQRDELVQQVRKEMKQLVREMGRSICGDPVIENQLLELSQQLGAVKGKKSYGYLPKAMKPLVDQIVDRMEKLPIVDACYGRWWELQCQTWTSTLSRTGNVHRCHNRKNSALSRTL